MQLLLGCGNSRKKQMSFGDKVDFIDLVTIDIDENCNPDVVYDLNNIPLPFADNSCDEIHAYNVLEHIGKQGDYKFFLRQFEDFWRMLKPDGLLFATVPSYNSIWAWGDPGHTRVINNGSLVFLSQEQYKNQIGVTPMTDYRSIYRGDLEVYSSYDDGDTFQFILKAKKGKK